MMLTKGGIVKGKETWEKKNKIRKRISNIYLLIMRNEEKGDYIENKWWYLDSSMGI